MNDRYDDEDSIDEGYEADSEPNDDLDTEADVTCPWCGEGVTITLDAGGGAAQDYVEDCEVCCRPWRVKVQYEEDGHADVTLEEG